MEDLVIQTFMTVITVILVLGILVIFLWRRKSRDDRRSYTNILNEPSVKTCYDPKEYTEARNHQDSGRKK